MHGNFPNRSRIYETRLEHVRKARENYPARWFRLLRYPLLLLLCLTFSYTCGLMASIPNDPLSEKEKSWTRFPNGFTWYAGTSQKWMTIALQPHSEVALKMLLMEKNPSKRQNIWLFTLLGLRQPEAWSHAASWAMTVGLSNWSGIWKEQDWKIGDRTSWGRPCGWTSGTKPKIWKLSCPCKCPREGICCRGGS